MLRAAVLMLSVADPVVVLDDCETVIVFAPAGDDAEVAHVMVIEVVELGTGLATEKVQVIPVPVPVKLALLAWPPDQVMFTV